MRLKIYAIMCLSILLTACNSSTNKASKILTVTNPPQQYFLEKIVGDKYSVKCIMPPGSNPENMDLTPSQLVSLNNSIAYFKIGYLDVENILVEKVKNSNPYIQIFETSDGIDVINEYHNDDKDGHIHGHAAGDPHTWSTPSTAKIIAKNMFNAILALDKENENYYTENYNLLIEEINNVNSEIVKILSDSKSHIFIIYHPALSYFARDYDLQQLAIEHEGKNPSPSQLRKLIDTAQVNSVQVVFIQQEYDVKNAESVAKAIRAKTVVIDLQAYDWKKEMIKIAKAISSKNE